MFLIEESRQDEVTSITSTLQPFNDVDGYDYKKPMQSFELPSQPEESKNDEVTIASTIDPSNKDYLPPASTNEVISTNQPFNEQDGYDYAKPVSSLGSSNEPGIISKKANIINSKG